MFDVQSSFFPTVHFEKHQGLSIVCLTFAHIAKYILCTQADAIKPKVKHGKEVYEAEQILRYVWEISNGWPQFCIATTQFCLLLRMSIVKTTIRDRSIRLDRDEKSAEMSAVFFFPSWKASFVSCGKVILAVIMIRIKNNMKIVSIDLTIRFVSERNSEIYGLRN